MSKAKEVTAQEVCLNNLKQLGQAFKAYAQDWNGWLPAYHDGTKWALQAVTPYVPNAPKTGDAMFGRDYLRCPAKPTGSDSTYGINYPIIFGYSERFGQKAGARLDKIHPSVYLAADAKDVPIYYYYDIWVFKTDSDGDGINDTGSGGKYNNLNPVHNEAANCLFADGHVEPVTPKDWLTNKGGLWGETDYSKYR